MGDDSLRVRIADPERSAALQQFLRRLGCDVVLDEPGTLTVALDASAPHEAARLELELYLRLWEATRPDSPAVVVA
jgi:hypothetical protein